MIEEYWNEVFGDFKETDGKFNIPGLPEPLMSAHFGVKNIVGSELPNSKLSLKLCCFPTSLVKGKDNISYQRLKDANSSSHFWRFHKKYNTGYEFLERLVPFLITLKTPHYHFYLEDEEGIIASAIVGVSESSCFAFNLVVRLDHRNQGKANFITEQIRSTFYGKRLFYWTIHPWFTLGSEVKNYHVL